MESGMMIKRMVMAYTLMLMELNIKDIGKMISSMVLALKLGQMDLATRAIIKTVKSMEREPMYGVIVQNTWVSGLTTR